MSQLLNSSDQLLSQLLPGPSRTLLCELSTGVCPVCVNSARLCVSYQWEGVGDFAIGGQLSPEAIGRK